MTMNYTKLISIAQLASHLRDPDLVVFDCRHDLMKPGAGAQAYAQGHVPGARFADTDHDLSGAKTGKNGRHPLPEPEALAQWLGRNGVDSSKQVVSYDNVGSASAARLWWLLKWLGHERVAVLDGGWEGWSQAGQAIETAVPRPTSLRFTGSPRPDIVGVSEVMRNLDSKEFVVVDARAADRFKGLTEPIDPVAGHIPGARNRLYKDNLLPDGRYKPAEQLRAEFSSLLAGTAPERIVHQCGSGVSACHNLLAMEIAGLPGSRLYPGSWSEWVADPTRPVAKD
jgi:thiosulfate/3-mercaptopyruvate sulfurtransferase